MSKVSPTTARGAIWPRVHPPFVRAMLAGHSALGLAFAALIYLVCFSGSIAVIAPDLPRWEKLRPQVTYTGPVTGGDLQRMVGEGLARAPWADDGLIDVPDKDNPGRLAFTVTPEPGDRAHDAMTWVSDNRGHLTAADRDTPFAGFIAGLHTSLHIDGGLGGFIVGAAGVALLSSLVSGLLSHPRVFKDAFNFRLGGSKRLQEVDIHNRLGVWALPFHILVSLSGALLGLTVLIVGILALAVFKGDTHKAYALFYGPHPAANERRVSDPIAFPAILHDIAQRAPGGVIASIRIEDVTRAGAAVNVTVTRPRHAARGEIYVYDRSGRYFGAWGNETGTIGQRIYSVLAPLHFGIFGGWPVKIAYVLLGLALTSVTSSGVAIWLARRRDKGRPAPRFERLWAAMVWSQPFAYAIAGIYALLAHPGDDDQIIPAWGAASLLAFALTVCLRPVPLSLTLRALSAGGLIALVCVHVRQVLLPALSAQDTDPLMWGVDIALIVTAGLLIYGLRRRLVTGRTVAPGGGG